MQIRSTKRFALRRSLGEGGMGVVYEAYDQERQVAVALKTIRVPSPDALARFKREFRVMQDVHHANVVTLGELFADGDECFFTMELVEGSDFLDYVRPTRRSPVGAQDSTRRVDGELGPRASATLERAPASEGAGGGGFDEARLRHALIQLAHALAAVHAAGIVHRDIKPSNVRVTHEGRVVLLDFGLVTEVASEHRSTKHNAVGTPAYMAPEQAASQAVGPAADWYGVGAMLYEALTGRLPFDGPPLVVLLAKQQREPPRPSAIARHVPADLDELCATLLRTDPVARSAAHDLLRALAPDALSALKRSHSQTVMGPFVGRERELGALRAAYDESRSGKAALVLLEGESGVGKSCVVKRFTDALTTTDPNAVVLHGRCYERETVPYKAFDGVVDALAQFLKYLARSEAAVFVPTKPAPLVQVFPVLRRVTAVAELVARVDRSALDPLELRSRAFAALREVFARLSDRRPLVLVVDDVQWADADSLVLLAEILREPEAPALLFVATSRIGAAAHAAAQLRRVLSSARTIVVERLTPEESVELATQLLQRAGADGREDAESIAREAGGHPLFMDALVRYSALEPRESRGALRLEEALWALISVLEEETRRLLVLLAMASVPLTQDALGSAAEMLPEELARRLAVLRVSHLVTSIAARERHAIDVFHDKIRSAVLEHLSEDAKRRVHRRLALAFEATGTAEAAVLSSHWQGAGEQGLAAKYAIEAGDDASSTFAFDRAASFYRRAIELEEHSPDELRALEEKLGDALASAGLGRLAAPAYHRAAVGANPTKALDLKRRAAEQLLSAGQMDEGEAALKEVLDAVGLALPRTPLAALVGFLLVRLYLLIRGLRFVERDARELAPQALTRVDACAGVGVILSIVDPVRGAYFQSRALVQALRLGEPTRVARDLAVEAGYVSCAGPRGARSAARLLERAGAIAERVAMPLLTARVHYARGFSAFLLGRFREAVGWSDQAAAILRNEAPGSYWDARMATYCGVWASTWTGEVAELARRAESGIREADHRGDLYASANLSLGGVTLAFLRDGDTAAARARVEEGARRWTPRGYHVQHYWVLVSNVYCDMYEGHGRDAWARVEREWSGLTRALILEVAVLLRVEAIHMRASAALAYATEAEGSQRAHLLRLAERGARHLVATRWAASAPLAHSLRAGIHAVRGDELQAAADLEAAARGFEALDMSLHAASARRHLGRLRGGEGGDALVRAADEWMRSQGIVDPSAMSALRAPGFARGG